MLELKQASHDELDRLAGLYGFVRKYDLLLPERHELSVEPELPKVRANQRFRINSLGKTYINYRGARIGFKTTEVIGIGIINSKALAKLTESK